MCIRYISGRMAEYWTYISKVVELCTNANSACHLATKAVE